MGHVVSDDLLGMLDSGHSLILNAAEIVVESGVAAMRFAVVFKKRKDDSYCSVYNKFLEEEYFEQDGRCN